MAAPVKLGVKQVKPILSLTYGDTRRRILNLYKAWHRQIPYILSNYDIPKTEEECKAKLREEFKRHAHVRDIRVIDVLLLKAKIEFEEVCKVWKTSATLMYYWKDSEEPKPTDFMSKFIAGRD